MTRPLLALLLALAAGGAAAEGAPHPAAAERRDSAAEPFVDLPGAGGGALYTGSRDSDGFVARRARLGGLATYATPYDFLALAAGIDYFAQGDWSSRGYSAFGILEKRERATGAGISASLGLLVDVDGGSRWLADALWNYRLSARTGTELIFQHDIVETRAAIEGGIDQSFLAASIDHAFTERLTGIFLAGAQRYSDDNDRLHARGWLIYALLPEQGLAVQARARAYENSAPGGPFYFNPEQYQNADLGLRLRRRLAGWQLHALLAFGEERIDPGVSSPTRFAQLGAERVLARDVRIGARYAYARAASQDGGDAEGDYTWQYLRVFVVAPF